MFLLSCRTASVLPKKKQKGKRKEKKKDKDLYALEPLEQFTAFCNFFGVEHV